jgi:hypothetical protein
MEWIETSKIGSIHIRTGAFETTTQLIFCSSPTWHWKMPPHYPPLHFKSRNEKNGFVGPLSG